MSFYRVEDYKGKIPSPRTFLVKDVNVVEVTGHPKMFSNGFMLDICVRARDIDKVRGKVDRIYEFNDILKNVIIPAKGFHIELSEPKYVLVDNFTAYGLTYLETKIKFVQMTYYNYFRNRYRKCQFFTSGVGHLIAVKLDGELVGTVMSLMTREFVVEVEKEIEENEQDG